MSSLQVDIEVTFSRSGFVFRDKIEMFVSVAFVFLFSVGTCTHAHFPVMLFRIIMKRSFYRHTVGTAGYALFLIFLSKLNS